MGRRRLQKKGDLRKIAGMWRGRWKQDVIDTDGAVQYKWSRFHDVGPCAGPNRLTRPEAEREFWNNFLSRVDENMRTPQSVLTIGEFVETKFLPEKVSMMKVGGRAHYTAALRYILEGIPQKRVSRKGLKMERGEDGKLCWPEPTVARVHGIAKKCMRDVRHEDIQKLVSEAIMRGYSVQTAQHIKNCASAIFTYADEIEWFRGRNPAKRVKLPEMTRREVHVLSFAKLTSLLGSLQPMARAMVLCASLTSMNIAEVCGLRWKRVNLTAEPVIMDGESLPAYHAAVREQWYLAQWGSVKKKGRRRFLPLPKILVEALKGLQQEAEFDEPNHPVFAGKTARPIDAAALMDRQVLKAAANAGIPHMGWHDLRRTFATLADQLGLSIGERQALMGHGRAAQTLAYTHTPTEAAIAALEKMGEMVKGSIN